jgi:predicted Zn-dependent peptidase
MKINEYISKELNEKIVVAEHPSGLKIYICEKPDYTMTSALYGTRYGSIDTYFQNAKDGIRKDIPEGTAHFLEHKLFESEDGGVFQKYAKTGGIANAYTSFDRTCYLFSCTSSYEENLKILLDFVQNPYLTEENVEKEKGIIAQEIKMYEDSAGWRVFFNLLQAMYHTHPVRIDIAGTVESITDITCDMLKDCYNAFYDPSNMFLAIAGNIDKDTVLKIVDENLKKAEPKEISRGFYNEPDSVKEKYTEQKLTVGQPIFALGFKESHNGERISPREIIITNLLNIIIAGSASPLFNRLLAEGLINDEFECEYFSGYGYGATIFSGESSDPQKVADEIKKEISRLRKDGIDKEEFNRILKKNYGREIMESYGGVDSISGRLVELGVSGGKPFEDIEAYKTITYDECMDYLFKKYDFEKSSLSVILPA